MIPVAASRPTYRMPLGVTPSVFTKQPSPFAAPNSHSPPKFRHSLLFTLLPINPRATLPHGRPRPRPNLEALSPSTRRSAPAPTTHSTHHSLPTAHYPPPRPLSSGLSDLCVALFSVLGCSSPPTLVFASVCRRVDWTPGFTASR